MRQLLQKTFDLVIGDTWPKRRRVVDSHGFDAAHERWPHISQRTLYNEWRRGQKILAKRCKQSEANSP